MRPVTILLSVQLLASAARAQTVHSAVTTAQPVTMSAPSATAAQRQAFAMSLALEPTKPGFYGALERTLHWNALPGATWYGLLNAAAPNQTGTWSGQTQATVMRLPTVPGLSIYVAIEALDAQHRRIGVTNTVAIVVPDAGPPPAMSGGTCALLAHWVPNGYTVGDPFEMGRYRLGWQPVQATSYLITGGQPGMRFQNLVPASQFTYAGNTFTFEVAAPQATGGPLTVQAVYTAFGKDVMGATLTLPQPTWPPPANGGC